MIPWPEQSYDGPKMIQNEIFIGSSTNCHRARFCPEIEMNTTTSFVAEFIEKIILPLGGRFGYNLTI